jgi:hypothetical protein
MSSRLNSQNNTFTRARYVNPYFLIWKCRGTNYLIVNPKVIRDLQNKCNIDGETPIEVAKKSGNEVSGKKILAKITVPLIHEFFFQGIAMLLEGDIFGAAKAGISVFEYVKMHPSTIRTTRFTFLFRKFSPLLIFYFQF